MSENQGTATNTATTLTLLQKCKNMLGVTDSEYEDEIQDLIDAAKADLGIAGVTKANVESDALVRRAIMTYVNMNWNISAAEYQNLLQSDETQKKQLMSATGYTDWLDGENEDPDSEAAGGGEG